MFATNRNLIGLYCYCEFENEFKSFKAKQTKQNNTSQTKWHDNCNCKFEVMLGERDDDTDSSDDDEVKYVS